MSTLANRNFAKGLVLVGIALAFGTGSLAFPMGDAMSPGPGLFPLIVSAVLGAAGFVITAGALFSAGGSFTLELGNASIIAFALALFAILTQIVNMAAGIVGLVAVASLAGPKVPFHRTAIVATVLLAIAFTFSKLLGLQLPLM